MNKYQIKALKMVGVSVDDMGRAYSKMHDTFTSVLSIKEGAITVRDDRDINSREYALYLHVGLYVEAEARIGGKWTKLENGSFTEPKNGSFNGAVLDFTLDNRPDRLRLSFSNGVVDPIEINLNYDLISAEEYERVQNSPEVLRKKMAVTYRTGENLVNIYWKHAKENIVASVRIDLYMKNGNDRQLMGKYKATDEVFFKSIEGLAYGDYVFELFQFDKDGSEVASSGPIPFSLAKPEAPNQGGFGRNGRWKNTVVIGG